MAQLSVHEVMTVRQKSTRTRFKGCVDGQLVRKCSHGDGIGTLMTLIPVDVQDNTNYTLFLKCVLSGSHTRTNLKARSLIYNAVRVSQ